MAKKLEKIEIPVSVLKTLRESSGYSINDVAKKLNSSTKKIESVEEGTSSFTITQVKKLAGLYQRPLVAFFSGEITPIPVIPDYRINRDKKLTPEVMLAKRRAYYLSTKLKEVSDKRSKIPTFSDKLKADELAQQFRAYLDVSLLKNKKAEEILNYYKKILEEKLLISIIEYPLKAEDVRAFCVSSELSIIVLNEQDKPEIKLFSLFHEICHLIKKSGGICSIEVEQENYIGVEPYCNLFAAEFLAPKEDLKTQIKEIGSLEQQNISKLSKSYGLSKQVIMLRLLKIGSISSDRYYKFKERFDKEEMKKKFGRRKWEKVFFNRIGNLAIQEVGNAYRTGRVSSSDVIDILNVKTKYIEKFIEI